MSRQKRTPEEKIIERIVEEKLNVLEDFYIVDDNNREDIRKELVCAIRENPNSHPDYVADRFAKNLIANKL
jgi:hypothetical protein